MLAHHPETGQPIRILHSDAQVSQSHRTLVWIQPTFEVSSRWNRWTTVISDPSAIAITTPQHIVVRTFDSAWIPLLTTHEGLVWMGQKAVDAFTEKGIDCSKFLVLEDLYSMYPYLGEPVHATDPVEKVLFSIAHVMRFRTLAGPFSLEDFGVKAQEKAWATTCQGTILPLPTDASVSVIPECWLFQQYYQPPQSRRAREINTCLEKNIENPYIDRIVLLNESATEVPPRFQVPKVEIRTVEGRLTYQQVLCTIQTCSGDTIAIFGNSDIWYDESLSVLWSIPLAEKRLFLALLRWEGEEIFGPRGDSQDSWIVARSTLDFKVGEEFAFPFGKPGCDNAISLEMLRKKCLVVNPAYSIKSYHIHGSNIRSYDPRDILYKPMYLYVDPTPIQLFTVERHLKPWKKDVRKWKETAPLESFFHELIGEDAETISKAFQQKEGLQLEANRVQVWTPPADPESLYEWKDAFVTPQGLVSQFRSIVVGDSKQWREGWSTAEVSSLTPAVHVPELAMVYTTPDCWTSVASWVLRVLPTILRIRESVGPLEFLVPTAKEAGEFLCHCMWKQPVGTVPYMEDVQYYTNRLVIPEPVDRTLSSEDVDRLRALLPSSNHSECIAVCLDELWTEGWWDEVATCHASLLRDVRVELLKPEDSIARRSAVLQSAKWVLGGREALRWAWMCRPGTKWIEWMLETDISSEIYYLAGAAHCKYIPSLIRKDSVEYQRQQALMVFGRLWQTYAFKEVVRSLGTEKPAVLLPAGKALEGMGAHAEDTFREMVQIWKERGYCEVQTTETSPYVWWGAVGDVLLYDWDTPRWWDPKTPYRLALFGNCAPPGPQGHEVRQSVWSFWPRSPRKLEATVESGLLPWTERTISSIFLGKIENGVQQAKRSTHDWSKAVEVFSMPKDTTGAYPYTQEEYLAKVRQSKFGLCLAGYGNKCNREIEYMALGVVPICTPEVDMDHYLIPPQEGIHYFRVKSPDQIKTLLASCSAEQWRRMSIACHNWWRANASAEGLFRTTWARIEQCKPFTGLMIPRYRPYH